VTASRSKAVIFNAKVLIKRLMASQSSIEGNFVHPCIINGHKTLVHAHDLASHNHYFYQQLQQYAHANHYALVADRRQKDNPDTRGRRKTWLPVIILSLSLNSAMAADTHSSNHGGFSNAQGQSVLSLFHPSEIEPTKQHSNDATSITKNHIQLEYTFSASSESQIIENILLSHYVANEGEPEYVQTDIIQMARYLSQYPEAVELISSLADKAWKLRYTENTFETEVRGNAFQIRAVDIRFDSRAAAKLRSNRSCKTNANACIASPADALLHELLHASSALLESKKFIAQGGMNSVLYPYAHEYEVIKNENKLYQAMSDKDGIKRPQRHRHAGKLVASSCSFCIQ
jgi:hypothetical protein